MIPQDFAMSTENKSYFKGKVITNEAFEHIMGLEQKIERLEHENKAMIVKIIETMNREIGARRDVECLRRIVKNQAVKIDSFKKIIGRIYWK